MTQIVSAPIFLEALGEDNLTGLSPMWDKGECLASDPELFFPEDSIGSKYAKRICATCEVAKECLEYALERDDKGIWGGASQRERRKIRKQRDCVALA